MAELSRESAIAAFLFRLLIIFALFDISCTMCMHCVKEPLVMNMRQVNCVDTANANVEVQIIFYRVKMRVPSEVS